MTQTALLCGCGSGKIVRNGFCPRCERRARLNREHFAGLRELVLRRDGYQCQCCGEVEEARLLVHHRRPGWNQPAHLMTLCRACHVRVHHTWRPRYSCPLLLRELWRETHRGLAEQRLLDLLGRGGVARQSPFPFE